MAMVDAARLVGSNNNFFDVENGILVQNSVQVIPTNSAGLQTAASGSGLSTDQATQLLEMWKLLALDSTNPVTRTPSSVSVDEISQSITGDHNTGITIERT